MKDKIKWSYTKIKTFQDCREKYYRKYVLKEYPPENHIKYMEGNIVQNLFEHFINYNHKDFKWLLDNIPGYYQKHFNNPYAPCTFRKADSEAKFLRSIKKMVTNTYIMMKEKGLFEKGVEIKSEVSITHDFEQKSLVHGKLDFVAEKDGELWLFDLKSRHTKYIDPLQLVFYCHLLQCKLGKLPDKTFFFASKDNKVLNLKVTQDQIEGLKGLIRKISKTVSSSSYRKLTSDENKCWGCANRIPCWRENNKFKKSEIKKGLMSLE